MAVSKQPIETIYVGIDDHLSKIQENIAPNNGRKLLNYTYTL